MKRRTCVLLPWLLSACQIRIDPPPADGEQSVGASEHGWDDRWTTDTPGAWSQHAPDLPSETPTPDGASLPNDYASLIVVEPGVLRRGGGASDDTSPGTFRSLMTWLSGDPDQTEVFTRNWLRRWSQDFRSGSLVVPGRPSVTQRLLQPWQGRIPSEDSDETDTVTVEHLSEYDRRDAGSYESVYDAAADGGSPPAADEPDLPLDWTRTPFELIALVNRLDLVSDPCSSVGAELRFVYGARDPQTGHVLDLTIIIEVPFPASRNPPDWAFSFDELSPESTATSRLDDVIREVLRDADPLHVRVRTNENALGEDASSEWQLREFRPHIVKGAMELLPAALPFTPAENADTEELARHALAHSEAIRLAPIDIPTSLQTGIAFIPTADFTWRIPGVSDGLRLSFSRNTCNGCHGGDTRSLPFQHIAANDDPSGAARLSPFLYDPDAESDELRRRQGIVRALRTVRCEPAESTASSY